MLVPGFDSFSVCLCVFLCVSVIVPLVFKDTYLDRDDALLSEYGIQHMSVIYICLPEPQGPGGGMGDKEGKNRSMEMLFLF